MVNSGYPDGCTQEHQDGTYREAPQHCGDDMELLMDDTEACGFVWACPRCGKEVGYETE